MTYIEISKDAALEAAREAAWTVDSEDSSDHGRTVLHCMGGFTGADWDLYTVEREIRGAVRVFWQGHILQHELCVETTQGHTWRFDVQMPRDGDRP